LRRHRTATNGSGTQKGRWAQPASLSRFRVAPGSAILATALAIFVAGGVAALPYGFADLFYLFSVEEGFFSPQQWVHPLYVPYLAGLRALLGICGWHGHMIVPLELVNIGASVVALIVLYRLAVRLTGDSVAAAGAVMYGMCAGFGIAAVRETPYALGFLCVVGSLRLLISEEPVPPRRYMLAGVLAGCAMALHASAMALAPTAIACALREPDPARSGKSTRARVVAFGAAMVATAVVSWAIFMVYHGIGPAYFRSVGFKNLFAGIEQNHGTSIYTSWSALTQLYFIADSLFGAGWSFIVPLVAFAVARRIGGGPAAAEPVPPLRRRFFTATFANFVFFGAFFAINNAENGFVYVAHALVPVLLAVVASRLRRARTTLLVIIPFTMVVMTAGLRWSDESSGRNEPLLQEVRFLQQQLGSADVVLTPGCPLMELQYLEPQPNLIVVFAGASGPTCHERRLRIDHALRDRIAWWTAHGSRVFLALGNASTDLPADMFGRETKRQIFKWPQSAPLDRSAALSNLRRAFATAGLTLRDGLVSPNDQPYAEVAAPTGGNAALPVPTLSLDRIVTVLRARHDVEGLWAGKLLARFQARIPDDPWAPCDTMQLACDHDATQYPGGCTPPAGCQ
jgi:hypothetical protein